MGEVEDGIVTECWMGCRSRVPGKFRARRGDGGGCRIRTRCRVRGGLRGEGERRARDCAVSWLVFEVQGLYRARVCIGCVCAYVWCGGCVCQVG